jgi:hypothetical protein
MFPPNWEPITPQEESQQHQWTPPNLPKQEA